MHVYKHTDTRAKFISGCAYIYPGMTSISSAKAELIRHAKTPFTARSAHCVCMYVRSDARWWRAATALRAFFLFCIGVFLRARELRKSLSLGFFFFSFFLLLKGKNVRLSWYGCMWERWLIRFLSGQDCFLVVDLWCVVVTKIGATFLAASDD